MAGLVPELHDRLEEVEVRAHMATEAAELLQGCLGDAAVKVVDRTADSLPPFAPLHPLTLDPAFAYSSTLPSVMPPPGNIISEATMPFR